MQTIIQTLGDERWCNITLIALALVPDAITTQIASKVTYTYLIYVYVSIFIDI
jgi:hypothetical protein